MNRIPFAEVQQTLAGVLRKLGFAPDRAQTCARLFAETTRDGVYTHGINRFARFVGTIHNGCVDPAGEAAAVAKFGRLKLESAGLLPWQIGVYSAKLTDAMRSGNWDGDGFYCPRRASRG